MRRPRLRPRPATPDPDDRRLKAVEELVRRGATEGERQAASEAAARLKAHHRPPQARHEAPKPAIDLSEALDVLLGTKLQVSRQVDQIRPCCPPQGCVATIALDTTATEPVTYSLRCVACRQHIGWLPHRVSDQLRHWVSTGRTSCPVLMDDSMRP